MKNGTKEKRKSNAGTATKQGAGAATGAAAGTAAGAAAKAGWLQSIKGKILAMGGTAILTSAVLGGMGIAALNKNSENYDVTAAMNRISLLQAENQSLDTTYLYFLDAVYLDEILANLDQMDESAAGARDAAGAAQRASIDTIQEAVAKCRENYSQIRDLSAERGFTPQAGSYQKFLAGDEQMQADIQQAVSGSSWLDGKWLMLDGAAQPVEVDGKSLRRVSYSNALPWQSKRDWLLVRLGGSGVDYQGTLYLNHFVLHGAGGDLQLPLASLTQEEMESSYKDGLKGLSLGTLGGEDSIVVDCAYIPPAPDTWMENIVRLPLREVDIQNYTSLSYDVYLTGETSGGLQAGFSLAEMYDFAGSLNQADSAFADYSKHVVEGSAQESEAETIRGLLAEIGDGIGAYISDEAIAQSLSGLLSEKTAAFEEMTAQDQKIIERKQENTALSDNLSLLADEVRTAVEQDTARTRSVLLIAIGLILAVSAVVLVILTLVISRSMNRSIRTFTTTLSEMTGGNLGVRARIRSRDEFSVFGKYVNSFLERLSEVIFSAQNMSGSVRTLGEELDGMVENSNQTSSEIGRAVQDISSSAATQVGETDSAADQIRQMGSVYEGILKSVDYLSDRSGRMRQVSAESAQLMDELGVANQKTQEVFSRVVEQTYTTNESVQKIREVTELITSIASQTNLLSLNATIEAARAGESGRGFAVVASEIQKLAEQSSQSAEIIQKIIDELAQEADRTVQIVDEVKEIVEAQQETLAQTKRHFDLLDTDIADSEKETQEIKERTGAFDEARRSVEDIITSLSSLSEENAQSSRETTTSMEAFNQNVALLADYSGRLKDMANELEQDLNFFHNFSGEEAR